ncbi:hypothetical protein F5884DRAFT_453060 [Xylogone sp. PMI_703]|nr:hypothetical protein F5884DRAFT_453060 [Xylogone sp. PMI_703]
MTLEFPPIYLLPTHLQLEHQLELEEQIPSLTYNIQEAKIVLGNIATEKRALFELRSRKLYTEDVSSKKRQQNEVETIKQSNSAKKRKIVPYNDRNDSVIIVDSSTESGSEVDAEDSAERYVRESSDHIVAPARIASSPPPSPTSSPSSTRTMQASESSHIIKVLKISWFIDSLSSGSLLPVENYLVYEGKVISPPLSATPEPPKMTKLPTRKEDVLMRAREDTPVISTGHSHRYTGRKVWRQRPASPILTRPTRLLPHTTSEEEKIAELPPIPEFLHTRFSCERPTPPDPPNKAFVEELKKIRTIRLLNADDVGVRAYSSSIAAIAAYPYTITSIEEILRLPTCNQKIAALYQEWKDAGHTMEADQLEKDPRLVILNTFYEIWGVGATTAREFYNKGWRDLDDVVQYGWGSLSRVQQIGVKYYEEFQEKIPRAEVENIGNVVLTHARRIDEGFQMVIVGGYRRGKSHSGDVDIVLSHPDEQITEGFISDIVLSLENSGWITHTLTLSTANSERNQMPVSWKGEGGKRGTGFDTLDKALVVWQDRDWPTKEVDLRRNPDTKNPNIHRRVDIIISPWKTAGCAVLGWSGGTTFQRDIRSYCRHIRNWKFDSSGVRSRVDGSWVDLERDETGDMIAKEKRVFQGLGLTYREPWERCTG